MMDEYAKYLEEKKAKPKGLSTFKLKVIGDVLMFLSAASMTLVPKFLGAPSTDDMGVLTVVVLCEAIRAHPRGSRAPVRTHGGQ